ncbi:hypothetical protein DB347_04935 [Opitutaceae bacterium EW11]|nr:hypothetical protein DB347_04935 [Opitutaceae bacterium EW11]
MRAPFHVLLRWVLRLAVAAGLVAGGFVVLLHCAPLFFRWSATAENLTLYADTPFHSRDGEAVLWKLRERLEAEPLYSAEEHHAIFVCNTAWRRWLFFLPNHRAAGLNYAPFTTNVFLSGGNIRENQLVNPAGRVIGGETTLAYFAGHEIGHTLTVESLGAWAYHTQTTSWLKDAYADRVGRGSVFQRPAARAAYLAETDEMNRPQAAPYLRYNLLLGQLLENERLTLREIADRRITRADAEDRLRRYLVNESGHRSPGP